MDLVHPAYGSERYAQFVRGMRGLVGFWRLDEGSGTNCLDQSGQRNGTLTGTPGRLKGIHARPGFGMGFTGTQYVTIADADALSIGTTGEMSWMCWTKPNDNVQNHVIAKGVNLNYEWGLLRGVLPLFTNGTGYVFQIWQMTGNSYAAVQTGANRVPNNQWVHIVATVKTGTTLIIYLNGVEKARSTTFSGSIGNGTSAMNIGRRPDNVRPYNGDVADVAVWNRQLTAGEVMALYAEGLQK